jgi:hypothetical protein
MYVPVRMAVKAGWRTVSSPSCVCNTSVGIEDLVKIWLLLLDELLQLCNFANLFKCKDLVLLVSIDGKTSRIVTTVFETGKTCRSYYVSF